MSDPIKRVIFPMMENRSFDHMPGGMAGVIPGLDGADTTEPRFNADGRPVLRAGGDPHAARCRVIREE